MTAKVDLDQQAQCGCGWKGKRWFLYMNARDEMLDHVRAAHGIDIRVVHLVPVGEQTVSSTTDAEASERGD